MAIAFTNSIGFSVVLIQQLQTCHWIWSYLFILHIYIWQYVWRWDQVAMGSQNINSLAPGTFEWNFKYVIFKLILGIDGWSLSCEIAPIWMSLDFTDDQSTLVQVMAWCRQSTSHYLSQCWHRSLSPYGLTRPQCKIAKLSLLCISYFCDDK